MRDLRRLVAAVVMLTVPFAVGLPARALPAPSPLEAFQQQLTTFSTHAPGRVAIAVEDVASGVTTGINPGREMPAASTIKIPVMVEVFRQLVAGDFDLNTSVTLVKSDRDWGYGKLCNARIGSTYKVSRLLSLMIDVSDNTATNMLIRRVGRQRINATMRELGLTHTHLGDFIRSQGPIRYALRSSPADMLQLLRAMAKEQLVDEWSSREMIAILRGQRHNGLIPEPLPPGTEIAHKTGTLHDTLNDVGIVYGQREEPYVIAVMTTDLPTLDAGRRFIRGVSKMAYTALAKFADWRDDTGFNPLDPERASKLLPDQQMWSPASTTTEPSAEPVETPAPLPEATLGPSH
jgi:beta-lactamase class A